MKVASVEMKWQRARGNGNGDTFLDIISMTQVASIPEAPPLTKGLTVSKTPPPPNDVLAFSHFLACFASLVVVDYSSKY